MVWRRKKSGDDSHDSDVNWNIWNRAATESGGPGAREGDGALASLLRLHSEAMSAGLLHAVTEGLSRDEFDLAVAGYRYFGLADAAAVTEAVLAEASDATEQQFDELEGDAGARYHFVVRDDSVLTEAFARRLSEAPHAFAPANG